MKSITRCAVLRLDRHLEQSGYAVRLDAFHVTLEALLVTLESPLRQPELDSGSSYLSNFLIRMNVAWVPGSQIEFGMTKSCGSLDFKPSLG